MMSELRLDAVRAPSRPPDPISNFSLGGHLPYLCRDLLGVQHTMLSTGWIADEKACSILPT